MSCLDSCPLGKYAFTFFEPWVRENNKYIDFEILFFLFVLFYCLENVKLTQVLLYILVETLWTLIR